MKILYWCGLFWPRIGGAEVLAMHYVNELSTRGHEVMIITDKNPRTAPQQDSFEQTPVWRFPFVDTVTGGELSRIKTVRNQAAALMTNFDADIVHLNSTGLDTLFLAPGNVGTRIPVVLTIHGFALDYKSAKNTLLTRAMATSDWVVGVSAAMLNAVQILAPEIRPRSSVIHNALRPPPGYATANPRAGYSQKFTILCAGRVVAEKGFDLAVRALPLLREHGVDAELIIAGDGPELENLKALAAQLNATGDCEFRGWVPPEDMYTMIESASVIVVPSRWEEPFGLIALQASQCAKPVVAARSGGLTEVIADGVSGMLFAKDDHRDLARRLQSLATDRKLQQSMGTAGQQRAARLFGMDAYVDQYLNLYQRLIDKP